jgi:hypothetical protein
MTVGNDPETSTVANLGPVDALMDLVRGSIEKLVIVERSAAELTESVSPGELNASKHAIIQAGVGWHVDSQQRELEEESEHRDALGVRVAVRPSILSLEVAEAYINGLSEPFPLVEGEIVTGRIDSVTLSLDDGSYGRLELRDAATFHERDEDKDPTASIEPLFTLNGAGILIPVVELIQLP